MMKEGISFVKNNKMFFIFWLLFFFFSMCSIVGLGSLGFPINFTLYNILKIIYFSIPIFIFFFLLQNWSYCIFLWLLTIYFFISWMYLPQALMYGSLSYGIIVSLFETNTAEALEYLTIFPWFVYVLFIGYLIFFLVLVYFSQKLPNKNPLLNYPVIWVISIITIIYYISIAPISFYIKEHRFALATSRSHIYPIKLTNLLYVNINQYMKIKDFLKDSQLIDTWEIISVKPKYQTYVLIIGESVRRDYMNLYGYPINNTPFLSKVNGTIFNNYISTAPNTHVSLERTFYLTNNKKEIIYHNTILNLVKKSKFQTYWLSNQGALGGHDRAASRIALQADDKFFLNKKTFTNTKFDDELLPKFAEVIATKTIKPKFIVLHLMGSHSDFCQRIRHQPSFQLINKNMSCYFESILQTDKLIENVNQLLQQQEQSYSVLYFADHGLSQREGFNDILRHNFVYKQNYEVPLIQFSSDDTKRTYINAQKSGFDLINGMAEWLGIQEKTLMQKPSFYLDKQTTEKVSVFNWEKIVDYDSLQDDPALPPKPYDD